MLTGIVEKIVALASKLPPNSWHLFVGRHDSVCEVDGRRRREASQGRAGSRLQEGSQSELAGYVEREGQAVTKTSRAIHTSLTIGLKAAGIAAGVIAMAFAYGVMIGRRKREPVKRAEPKPQPDATVWN